MTSESYTVGDMVSVRFPFPTYGLDFVPDKSWSGIVGVGIHYKIGEIKNVGNGVDIVYLEDVGWIVSSCIIKKEKEE